jgi:hypothetical protein
MSSEPHERHSFCLYPGKFLSLESESHCVVAVRLIKVGNQNRVALILAIPVV